MNIDCIKSPQRSFDHALDSSSSEIATSIHKVERMTNLL
jgi:hypothetical protein